MSAETKATPQKTVKLLKPHRHAGRNYAPGMEITLAAHKADWLISVKTAEPLAAAASAAPAAVPATSSASKPAKD